MDESTVSKRKLTQLGEDELLELIEKFDNLRLESHRQGRFLDAEAAKNKLKKLNDALDKVKKKEMKGKHHLERNRLDEDFDQEIEQFNIHWEEKIMKYKEECTKLEEMLLEKQREDFENYEAQLEETISVRTKDSAKLLEARSMVDQLAKNQEYKDAHYLQLKCLKMEEEEKKKYEVERENKIRHLLEQLATKQRNEHSSLRKKIITGLEELELKREKEYEMLLLKYNNMKRSIQNQQNMETQLFDKTMRTNRDLNRSTMTNLRRKRQKQMERIGYDEQDQIQEEDEQLG